MHQSRAYVQRCSISFNHVDTCLFNDVWRIRSSVVFPPAHCLLPKGQSSGLFIIKDLLILALALTIGISEAVHRI
jgi:uncharacterized membrane protein YqaE (UPF0057 family)